MMLSCHWCPSRDVIQEALALPPESRLLFYTLYCIFHVGRDGVMRGGPEATESDSFHCYSQWLDWDYEATFPRDKS